MRCGRLRTKDGGDVAVVDVVQRGNAVDVEPRPLQDGAPHAAHQLAQQVAGQGEAQLLGNFQQEVSQPAEGAVQHLRGQGVVTSDMVTRSPQQVPGSVTVLCPVVNDKDSVPGTLSQTVT